MISPVNLSVRTSIPAKSSGRLLDALTDLIRPLTERMGLKADLIRLQREEVAYRVAAIAAERVRLSKKPVTPVPTKTMVRLLEAASLEEPEDDTMVRLWANLLASAAIGGQNNVPRYISILSDINGSQAGLIQAIMTRQGKVKRKLDADLLMDNLWSMDRAGVLLKLKQELTQITPAKISKAVREHIDICGVAISDVIVNRGEDQWDGSRKGFFPVDELGIEIETLESLSLLKDVTFKNAPIDDFELSVFFYRVTSLCVDMFAACNPDIIGRQKRGDAPKMIKGVTSTI